MEYIINHFESFANVYVSVWIEIYLLMVAALFAYFLFPFTEKKKASVFAALVYGLLTIINNHVDISKSVSTLITIGIVVLTFLAVWLFDERRNPVQKILLCVLFRLISWLSIEN